MLVTLGELKDLIRSISKDGVFAFAPPALNSILAYVENWQQDWTDLFIKILKRIESGRKYYEDQTNTNGRYMPLPFPRDSQSFMVVYYSIQWEKRYLIYDLKIIKENK